VRAGRRPRAAAGQYNRRITLRTVTRTPDGGGGYTETPVDVTGVPASVDPLEGREQVEAMQTGMERPHRFEMRYRTDITGATRIVYDARTFDVKSIVDPEDRHVVLVILADEVGS
jgi:SPP1 family predicted phage head-tail adaptor